MDHISLEEAQRRIVDDLQALPGETVDLLAARDRVCTRAVQARRALPAFANSVMDGYAVRACDTVAAPVELPVAGTVAAGDVPRAPCAPRTAWRIFTGAALPPGADAVVMQEETQRTATSVMLSAVAAPGQYVRQVGEDVAVGDVVLPAGRRVQAGDISALAAQGRSYLQVVRRPRVAIVPTGAELLGIDADPEPGRITDSNSMMLAAQVEAGGGVAILCPAAPDEPEALTAQLRKAARQADLVLTSGGVSVGELDYVRQAIEAMGSLHFWRVAIKPGKPLAYGRIEGTPLIGLPGNPASSFVCFELFVRPALRRLQGEAVLTRPWRRALLTTAMGPRQRREFVRARLHVAEAGAAIDLFATPLAKQASSQQSSLCGVDALVELPRTAEPTPAGTPVAVLVLNSDL